MIFWENIDKNQKKVLEKLYKRAFTQLSTILYSFQAKIDQSQPAFFFGTEEVILLKLDLMVFVLCNATCRLTKIYCFVLKFV